MTTQIGYFVHHQGRGHAERAASIANALSPSTDITFFCARPDIFPSLPSNARVVRIPSLFEQPDAIPAIYDRVQTPSVLHCAPVGWPTITQAVATITQWFHQIRPALFVTDVSAELSLLARIASIPSVAVLQHGDRSDPGHVAAYESAIGILAPYHPDLEQTDRPKWMRDKTTYFGGLGIDAGTISKAEARNRLQLSPDADIVVVVGGGGGAGLPIAPLTLGARAEPHSLWLTIGEIAQEWHATLPANLRQMGWVNNPADWIAAADRVVSSAGNTTVHMIAAAGRPWIVIPEWRYFEEQVAKANALSTAGAAVALRDWPAHVEGWQRAWLAADQLDHEMQRRLVDAAAPARAAAWLEDLAALAITPATAEIILEVAQ